MTTHKRYDWLMVPREYVSHGTPKHGVHSHKSFASEAAGWAYIEQEIKRLDATVPDSGDGADYLACRIAELESMTVVHRSTLRKRTYDEARSLHHRFPQFYPAP